MKRGMMLIHIYLIVTEDHPGSRGGCPANLAELEKRWALWAGPLPKMSQTDVERLPWDEVC